MMDYFDEQSGDERNFGVGDFLRFYFDFQDERDSIINKSKKTEEYEKNSYSSSSQSNYEYL